MRTIVARLRHRHEAAVQSPARRSRDAAQDGGRRGAAVAKTGVFGRTVAVVGELSEWPDRGDVRAAIGAVGGRYLEVISHQVDVVVLGSPADDDDAAAGTIRRARKMVDAGHHVQIIDEAEFIALIGLPIGGPEDPLVRSPVCAGRWRDWGAPVDGVADTDWHVQEFVRLLGRGAPAGTSSHERWCSSATNWMRRRRARRGLPGLVVGRLVGAGAARVADAMKADSLDRIRIPAVLYGGAAEEFAGFGVGLWPERAAAMPGTSWRRWPSSGHVPIRGHRPGTPERTGRTIGLRPWHGATRPIDPREAVIVRGSAVEAPRRTTDGAPGVGRPVGPAIRVCWPDL